MKCPICGREAIKKEIDELGECLPCLKSRTEVQSEMIRDFEEDNGVDKDEE